VAAFEELWLVRRLGEVSSEKEIDEIFDAFRTPRARRGDLRIPGVEFLKDRLAETRADALEGLAKVDLSSTNPLLRSGYVYEMVRDHEAQHQETILQAIFLLGDELYQPVIREPLPGGDPAAPAQAFLRVPEGTFRAGDRSGRFAYDNERPSWEASTGEYEIGRYPVTNREFTEFIAAGGYLERRLWSEEGWKWRTDAGLAAPGGWRPRNVPGEGGMPGPDPAPELARRVAREDGLGGWVRRSGLGEEPIAPESPVEHVCFWEAEACARFFGARLPTELEWEKAAAWDPSDGRSRVFPWGDAPPGPDRANLDQLRFGPAPVTSYPGGSSALGCMSMIGDVWEWTSSEFRAWPGFQPFPYEEYSAVFFESGYRVLRGGSWATRASVARNSFRNWDYPIRRQIFAGFRLARDV
jgi:iron(II)-dependent oxidoreductase